MRNAIVRMPENRTNGDRLQVLSAAIRQLDRAAIYVAAVEYMTLDDEAARRAIRQLRMDLVGLQRHLGELRADAGS